MTTLTDHQRRHLVHCLRVAATQFDQDAQLANSTAPALYKLTDVDKLTLGLLPSSELTREFTRYAVEARELADLLDDAIFVRYE